MSGFEDAVVALAAWLAVAVVVSGRACCSSASLNQLVPEEADDGRT